MQRHGAESHALEFHRRETGRVHLLAEAFGSGNLRMDSGKYEYASREPEIIAPTAGNTRAEKKW